MVLVIDGHDCSGKTTLTKALCQNIGASYVKPFFGEGGELMLAAAEEGRTALAARLARDLVKEASTAAAEPIQVFDRHWMTVFTLLPESHWEPWFPLPPTILCWSNLPTTLERLKRRGEALTSYNWHVRYLACYDELARRFTVPFVRTDHFDESAVLQRALDLFTADLED